MQGLHITADLQGCACPIALLSEAATLGERCVRAVEHSGLQAVAQLFHKFPDNVQGPAGVTATVLLAESHLCVHTWPEHSAVTIDVYVCNFGADHSAKAEQLMASLQNLFVPTRVRLHRIHRGV